LPFLTLTFSSDSLFVPMVQQYRSARTSVQLSYFVDG
jgi:hypothetical protein